MNKKIILLSSLCTAMFFTGCQKQSVESEQTASVASEQKPEQTPVIQSKTIPVKLPQQVYCEADECTEYEVSTVETNVPWINDYFEKRIRKDIPLAFKRSTREQPASSPESTNSNTYVVDYLSQNNNLATFILASSTYSAGAAHGMYHREYVVFDLTTHKRVMASDLYKPEDQPKVLEALYLANQNWLQEHGIEQGKLEPTDNFFYSSKGVVFVYPLYELGSYAEGMTELTLPYNMTQGLIKSDYLPH